MTLNGTLGSSFRSMFSGAQSQVQSLSRAIREMQRTPTGQLGAQLERQRGQLRNLGTSLNAARANLANLQAQARAAGGATGILARQISLAESRVNRLSSSFARQSAAYRNSIAEARSVAGSIRNLSQEYRGLSASMAAASAHRGRLMANQSAMQANSSRRSELQGQLMSSVATGMSVAFPAKLAMDFEQQMAKVGAVSRASAADMDILSARAREMGRDTQFSAVEAGKGMEFLAMAGFSTQQTYAAIPGTLNLAAASGSDLGVACDIASNMMTGFGIEAERMGHVSDVLVSTFTSSNSTLETLGETMKYVAPVSKSLGVSFEDTAAMAGLLHNAGIQSSMAGTAMRSIMLRMAAPPSEAKKALESLAISTKDAVGNMRPMSDLLTELMVKTKDMGNAQKADIFKDIAGTESVSALMVLGDEAFKTTDKFGNAITNMAGKQCTALEKYMEQIKNCDGVAKTTADRMTATTHGALKRLGSAWSDVGITIGNFFLPVITGAANVLTTVAGGIASFTEKFPNLSKGIALAVGGLLAFSVASKVAFLAANIMGGGLLALQRGFLLARGAALLLGSGVKVALISTGIGALLVGLGVAAWYVYENWEAVSKKFSGVFSSISSVATSAKNWIVDTWAGVKTFFSTVGPAIYSRIAPYIDRIKPVVSSVANFITDVWRGSVSAISGIWNSLSGFASTVWNGVGNIISGVATLITATWNTVGSFFTGLWTGISNTASTTWNFIGSTATTVITFIQTTWSIFSDWLISIWNVISNTASTAWNWIASSCAPVANFLIETWNVVSNILTGVWDGVVAAADYCWTGITNVFSPAVEWFSGIAASIQAVFDSLFGWLKAGFAWVMDTATEIKNFVAGIFGGVAEGVSEAAGKGKNAAAASEATRAMSADSRHKNSTAKNAAAVMSGDSRHNEKKRTLEPPKIGEPPKGQTPNAAKVSQGMPVPPPAPKGGGGGKAKAGGGGGGGRSRAGGGGGGSSSSAKTKETGPTTIVRLAGDNKNFTTEFIPAGMSTGTAKRVPLASGASSTPATKLARGTQSSSHTVTTPASTVKGGGISGKQVPVSDQPTEIVTEKPVPVFVTNFPAQKNAHPRGQKVPQLAQKPTIISQKEAIPQPINVAVPPQDIPQPNVTVNQPPLLAAKPQVSKPKSTPKLVNPDNNKNTQLIKEKVQEGKETEDKPIQLVPSPVLTNLWGKMKEKKPEVTKLAEPLLEGAKDGVEKTKDAVLSAINPFVPKSIKEMVAPQKTEEKAAPSMPIAANVVKNVKENAPQVIEIAKEKAESGLQVLEKQFAPAKTLLKNTFGKFFSNNTAMSPVVSTVIKEVPQTEELLQSTNVTPIQPKKEKQKNSSNIEINMNQDFAIDGTHANELKRRLEALRPDIDKMVRRAIGDMQQQNRRLAHVQ